MAFSIRQIPDIVVYALVLAWNQWRAGTAQVGALFHADTTSLTTGDGYTAPVQAALTVSAANAADLPTSITLANQIQSILQVHWKDAISTNRYAAGAHKVPDTTNNTLQATAVDLPTTIALANFMKTQFNAHLSQSGVHFNNDGTSTVAATNASDLPTSITLLNAIKTSVNTHMASAPLASSMINILPT